MAGPLTLEEITLPVKAGLCFLISPSGDLFCVSRTANVYRRTGACHPGIARVLFLAMPGSTEAQRRAAESVLVRYFQPPRNKYTWKVSPELREWLYQTHPGLTRRVARALRDEGVHVTPTLVG